MLDPRRVVVLREFAQQGTIARAADALGFTPSAVSQQLAQLQRETGVELLRRTGRRLELTDAGRTLVERGTELLDRLGEVEAELAAHAGAVRGVVKVAAFQTASLLLVVPALARLADEHPGLRVEVLEAEAEESLPLVLRGEVDVALAEEYDHAPRPRPRALHRVDLPPDDLLLAVPSTLALGTGPLPLASLADQPWVVPRAGTAYADMCIRMCRSTGGFEPTIAHRANDLRLLLALVAQGCVAIVPALARTDHEPGIAVHPIAEGPFTRALFAAVRTADRERPSVRAVVSALAADGAAR